MIKLVVGLGNPGKQYEKNRHNAGFLFLDYLLDRCSGSWLNESRFHGLIANSFVGGQKVILLKPQTFMNRSGLSVGAIARFYKLKSEEILVVHDELDLAIGKVRLKKAGGHAGHNGLRDIISSLGDKDFYRIRLGIGRPNTDKAVVDHVLSNFYQEERRLMDLVYDLLDRYLDEIISGDVARAMNGIN